MRCPHITFSVWFRYAQHGRSFILFEFSKYPNPNEAITSKSGFIIRTIIFIVAVVLLVTHAQPGLTVAFIGTFIAIITLITSGKAALKLLKKIDYKTLLFFIGLFIVVGGLEETGILEILTGLQQ